MILRCRPKYKMELPFWAHFEMLKVCSKTLIRHFSFERLKFNLFTVTEKEKFPLFHVNQCVSPDQVK